MAMYRESRTPRAKGKVLKEIHIKPDGSGGHVVEHHYEEDGWAKHDPKKLTYGADEGAELMAHLTKHAHINTEHETVADEEGE